MWSCWAWAWGGCSVPPFFFEKKPTSLSHLRLFLHVCEWGWSSPAWPLWIAASHWHAARFECSLTQTPLSHSFAHLCVSSIHFPCWFRSICWEGILIAIMYGCGCLGGAPTDNRLAPGSGSRGFVKDPQVKFVLSWNLFRDSESS